MKKTFPLLLMLSLLLSACINLPAPAAPTESGDGVATIVAATMQALNTSTPQATETPSGVQVSFQNVSFVIPQGLALGANGEAIPEFSDDGVPWEVAPAHVRFTFFGYNDSMARFGVTQISVYPMKEFAAINNGAAGNLPRLQAILSTPDAPIGKDAMPRIPFFNAGPMFSAQAKLVRFNGGAGAREITQYGQAVGPASNGGTFYHFQGLTSDGEYYVIAILPIGASFLLPANQLSGDDPNAALPADGVPFPGYTSMNPADYEEYFQAVVDKLNAATPDAYTPSLTLLDALIQSITIAP